MKIVVNQLAALGVKTGIGHYTSQLLHFMNQHASSCRIDAFPTGLLRHARQCGSKLRAMIDPPVGNRESTSGPAPAPTLRSKAVQCLRTFGRAVIGHQFRKACKREKYDLYHEPNFIPLPSDCLTVTTIHDLSALRHPHWHPADRVAFFQKNFLPALGRSSHFLTISEFVRQEIIQHLGIAEDRVTNVHLAARSGLGPLPNDYVRIILKQLGLPSRYLLYLGTLEPRKNIMIALRAYCSLPSSVRERWPFVLVGGWGWRAGEIQEFLEQEAKSKNVIHVGYLSEDHLACVYNGARALVFPSHYEGFGLPPLEMMACGGAVLASRAGAIVETVGKQAHLIDADDFDGWRQGIQGILTDDDWHASLCRGAIEHAQSFTWQRCAEETLNVYRALLGKAMPIPISAYQNHSDLRRKAG